MRRAQAGKLTREAEQAFLAALSATCNVTLAAAAVGSCFGAFNRRRKKDPAFAREMRMALQRGYEALELALLESSLPVSHEHDEWRHNEPPAMPPMSVNQALQLMYLHQKAALLARRADPDPAAAGREQCGAQRAARADGGGAGPPRPRGVRGRGGGAMGEGRAGMGAGGGGCAAEARAAGFGAGDGLVAGRPGGGWRRWRRSGKGMSGIYSRDYNEIVLR